MPLKDTKSPVVLTGQLKWVERIAHLFDDQFRIPGTNFKFGLDPIINLIPLAGDVSGFMVGAALVWVMAKNGVSRKVLILMVLNICIDALLGAIPFVGQVTDFYFKSNTANLKLLKEHYQEGKHQGSGTGTLVLIFLGLCLFFGLVLYTSFVLFSSVYHWLFN
jgi:hypothetical protein